MALDGLKGRVEGTVRVAAIYSVGISDMSGWSRRSRAACRRPSWWWSICARSESTKPCSRTRRTWASSATRNPARKSRRYPGARSE